ncbi:MAG: hypothetical protein JW946_02730 [Candidatus Omnitrophica bacterium]|nr:hypothetical protein [Candidatus Omnitrophota bacterium]
MKRLFLLIICILLLPISADAGNKEVRKGGYIYVYDSETGKYMGRYPADDYEMPWDKYQQPPPVSIPVKSKPSEVDPTPLTPPQESADYLNPDILDLPKSSNLVPAPAKKENKKTTALDKKTVWTGEVTFESNSSQGPDSPVKGIFTSYVTAEFQLRDMADDPQLIDDLKADYAARSIKPDFSHLRGKQYWAFIGEIKYRIKGERRIDYQGEGSYATFTYESEGTLPFTKENSWMSIVFSPDTEKTAREYKINIIIKDLEYKETVKEYYKGRLAATYTFPHVNAFDYGCTGAWKSGKRDLSDSLTLSCGQVANLNEQGLGTSMPYVSTTDVDVTMGHGNVGFVKAEWKLHRVK